MAQNAERQGYYQGHGKSRHFFAAPAPAPDLAKKTVANAGNLG
jgi:hypothetical protein